MKRKTEEQESQVTTKINFAEGVIHTLDLNAFKNVLVLTGTQYSLEIFEKKIRPLIKTNCHVYPSITTNLTDYVIYGALNFASDKNIDCIISVGPQAVMNCGRFVSLLLTHGGFLHDYLPGGTIGPHGIHPNKIYHITVPTMPSAGYEIANFAHFYYGTDKYMVSSPYLIPKATYIDPLIMRGLPSDLWAVLGFDCFITAMAAYVSMYANPTSDAYAKQAMETFLAIYKKLLQNPQDTELIKQMCAASINSFLATNYSSTGAAHAIAAALAARFGFQFGTALAVVAGEVASTCYASNKERFDYVAKLIGATTTGGPAIKSAINNLIKQLGIKAPKLKDKFNDVEIEKLAYSSMNCSMKGNAKTLNVKDVIKILGRL